VLGNDKVNAVLDDYEKAPIDERLRATLGFLKKMTLEPDALGPADARAVLAAGATRAQLDEAIHVAYAFNIFDRMADSLGFALPDRAGHDAGARVLLKRGYKL